MMKFIILLCFASVGVNAAWLRRQETLSRNDLSENTGTDKADSFAEANSTSGADQEEAVEATEEFFNGGFGNPGRKSGKYGVSRPKNESMLRSNKGDGFEQGAGSSSAVNNRISLCLNGEDCGKKEEDEKPQTPPAPEPEAETEEPQPEGPQPEAPTDPAILLAQNCARWASDDQCNKNPAYMLQKCSQQCDEWCDETTCDQRILAHWRKCLDYARGGACYSNTGYMKTACNAFCPKQTYPPDGFNKNGGPNHQTGQPLQVPVQEPAYVHPGVQLDPNWNTSHPLWSSQAGATATSSELADAVSEAGRQSQPTGSGGVLPKTPSMAPRSRLPEPQQDDPSALPAPPSAGPALPGDMMSLLKPQASIRRRPPAAAPQPPQPTAAYDSKDVVVLSGKPRATRRDGGRQAPPDAPHGGRRSRIGTMLADTNTINFTMDIALSPGDLNNVQSLVNYANWPARHALEASLRGMLAARLAQRETGLKVIAKNVQIIGMEMRRLVHSSKGAIPSVLHVRAAILSPLIKAGLLGKDALTLLGKRIGKKLLEDAFKVAGTPVRITNYYVGL